MVETDGDELGVMVMLQDKPLPGSEGEEDKHGKNQFFTIQLSVQNLPRK